jgi:poly [ADP-ribose] polymerase 6/8
VSRKRLREDIANATSKFAASVRDVVLDDESLTFRIGSHAFHLMMGDYPSCTVLYVEGRNDPDVLDGSLDSILAKLVQRYAAPAASAAAASTSAHGNPLGSSSLDSLDASDDGQHSSGTSLPVGRRGGGGGSTAWRSGSDVWGDGGDDGGKRDWRDVPLLKLDVERCREALKRDDAVAVEYVALLEQFDVTITIDCAQSLSTHTASAWGVDLALPIFLKLSFSELYSEALTEPGVDLYQIVDGVKASFRLKFQLYNIIKPFVKRNWHKYVNKSPDIMDPTAESTRAVAHAKAPPTPQHSSMTEGERKAALAALVDMGFPREESLRCVAVCHSLDEAVMLLTENDGTVSEEVLAAYKESHPVANNQNSASTATTKTTTSSSSSSANKETGTRAAKATFEELMAPKSATKTRGMHNGAIESATMGFLVMCVWYLQGRIKTCHEYCVICDQPHVFSHGHMLKPSICSRELCVWSFQQLGVGADADADLATSSSLVDLLVRLAQLAGKSARNSVIFDPYPLIFDAKDRNKMVFDPKKPDFAALCDCLNKFPSMSTLVSHDNIKEALEAPHPHAYAMMQWLINSNRSHMVVIDPAMQLAAMDTPHQFLMLSAAPEHEHAFQEGRKLHGSTFAFHGSPVENWHSILRTGLRNASGTKLQIHGAAYGAGVYISPHAATSLGYCRPTVTATTRPAPSAFLRDNLICMALCEVVNHEIRKSGNIWVQPNPLFVVTRFFFVWEHNPAAALNVCDTQAATGIITEIKKALHHHGLEG